ncbi:MAG: aldehyde dehydrogenase family protein, partial [Janthinobacterium lividum]
MDSFDPNGIKVRSGHFIGGEYVDEGSRRIDVTRPSDGAVYASVPLGDAALVDRAVENAWQAFRTSGWATMAPRERARILRCFADLIAADVDTLAPLEALGSTRPVRDAAAWDVPFTA